MTELMEMEQNTKQGKDTEIAVNPTTHIVEFTEDDVANPRNWRPPYKWSIVVLVASFSAVVQLSTIIAAPVSPAILVGFHSNNVLYRTLIVSIWELGEIVAPLIWGPLSELYGRRWVLNIANVLFIAFHAGTALSTNIHMLIAFRFLSGAATASLPIGPGVVRDLFEKERRGRAMSIMSLTTTLGVVAGPIVGSYLGEREGWRWAFWLPTIVAGVLALLLLAVYRETYQVTILMRKAKQRRRETGNLDLRSKYETGETDASAASKLFDAFIRPLRLLIRSPILILITVYISVVYGYVYLMMTTIAPVFQEIYSFSTGASGLCFLGLCLGLALGAFICSFLLDRYIRMAKARASAAAAAAAQQIGSDDPSPITPEHRLPPVLFSCIFMSSGFFLFGWTVHVHVHFIVPIIGTAIIGLGLVATTISLQTYIVDVFGIYAVSATSAMLVPRNASAAFLPLAGPPLFQRLGYHWGGTLLGLVVLAFAVMPMGFMRWGGKLRGRYGSGYSED
ncbi:MFS general substrate transporter [Aspergillus affinis]|uniref:MFS general substrate transporter n=1 Tax=Aspergillus affinis TaxID=1070780 RepID=UPI0022FF0FCA|nr:MFS general substrate transporter [Aspergillus affinis]KAI9041298.1 MFS general substrate transporter [Aspergillus affinis]